jgi:phospholipase/carboxylesterase
MTDNLHRKQPVLHAGIALEKASGVVVFLHGRGASAEDILDLAKVIYHPELAYLAPQSAGHTWYPYSFLAPREQNEPWLSSALEKVTDTVLMAREAGIPNERITICGFSQGACLATEFVVRHPQRYAALIAFTGGLIGASLDPKYTGDLKGTPAFLGSGDPDPHVPWTRVEESAEVLRGMNASVTTQRYVGRPHTISREEFDVATKMVSEIYIN